MLVNELEDGLAERMTYSEVRPGRWEGNRSAGKRSRERPPRILWPGILVISGQRRMMYQCLTPKTARPAAAAAPGKK